MTQETHCFTHRKQTPTGEVTSTNGSVMGTLASSDEATLHTNAVLARLMALSVARLHLLLTVTRAHRQAGCTLRRGDLPSPWRPKRQSVYLMEQERTRTIGRGRHTGDAPTRGLLAATAGARLAGLPSGQKSREDLLRRNSQSGLRARGAQRGRHGSTRQRQEYQLCRGFTWPERLRKIRVRFACHHACASAAAPPSRQRLGTPRLSPGMQGMRLRSRGCAVGDSSLCALVNITASAVLSSPLPPPSCAFSCVDQPALPKNTCVSLNVVRSWIVRMCDHHLDNPSAARISHHFTTRRPTCTAEGCYKRAAQPAPAERTHTHTQRHSSESGLRLFEDDTVVSHTG